MRSIVLLIGLPMLGVCAAAFYFLHKKVSIKKIKNFLFLAKENGLIFSYISVVSLFRRTTENIIEFNIK